MSEINFVEQVARQKLGVGNDWLMYAWEVVGELEHADLIVTGGVPVGLFQRGPRKGRPKWDRKLSQRVVVTRAEERAALLAFEASTGKCSGCQGSGEQWAGWSAESGNRTRPCRRCQASGVAPALEGPQP
ncbi:hypothetical protein [Luteimonas notoginsengisoli]|uniref:Uncharacterized protein n=1 Tax=Luteimonas notoginsengisoli TaxID=1578200 RepID=A0ABV7UQH3_9GAMM